MSQEEGGGPPIAGLDDPEVLAEIEAEFAELTAEIEKINALPRSMAPRKAELIKDLKRQWLAKRAGSGDRPEWRKKMDDAIGEAITQVLEDGIQETPDGRMEFALQNESLQVHGGPLMQALLTGFKHMLAEKLAKRPAPGAPKAPPNPLQGLMLGLGQMLVQALDNTQKSVDAKKKQAAEAAEAAATAKAAEEKPEAGAVELKLTPDGGAKSEVDVAKLNASVGFDTRKGDAVPPILPEMFQSVLANLGTMLNQAARTAPAKKPAAAPKPAAAEKQDAAPAAKAEPPPAAEEKTTAAEDAAPEASAEPAAPAAEPPPVSEDAATAKPEALQDETPKPTVKIDFAGLFGQLFKLAPHGVATRRPAAPEAAAKKADPAPPPPDAAAAKSEGDPPEGADS